MNPYEVVFHPFVTEKSMMLMEKDNSLQFAVSMKANKRQIKEALEEMFGIKVVKVTTRIGKNGKVAVAKLSPEYVAEDIGMRIGIF